MKYRQSVSEFLKESKKGNIDYSDFYAYVAEQTEKNNKKFDFLVTMPDIDEKTIKTISKGNLKGLPITAKDAICTKGIQSSAGAEILKGYIPPFDATCISRIKKEGGIIIGKTAQDEFGFGTFCINTALNKAKNPNDISRSPGGSSGGSGIAAAALDFPHVSLGESTGGSISCPASFCGAVGLTPTYGRVSRYGLIDYANSLDKIGPIGKTTEDVATILSHIAGQDPMDSTSAPKKSEDYTKYINKDANLKGTNIAVPKEFFKDLDAKVEKNIREGIAQLESLGANINEVSLKMTDYATAAYYMIATAEASTNLAKYSGMRYGQSEKIEDHFDEYFQKVRSKYFTEESKRRILLGTFARMEGYRDQYYLKAMKIRTLIIEEMNKVFKNNDAIVGPTMPIIAPKFTEIDKLSAIDIYTIDTLSIMPNLAGTPMLSIPCGTINNMPIGMQIISSHLNEGRIINIGSALENS